MLRTVAALLLLSLALATLTGCPPHMSPRYAAAAGQ